MAAEARKEAWQGDRHLNRMSGVEEEENEATKQFTPHHAGAVFYL